MINRMDHIPECFAWIFSLLALSIFMVCMDVSAPIIAAVAVVLFITGLANEVHKCAKKSKRHAHVG